MPDTRRRACKRAAGRSRVRRRAPLAHPRAGALPIRPGSLLEPPATARRRRSCSGPASAPRPTRRASSGSLGPRACARRARGDRARPHRPHGCGPPPGFGGRSASGAQNGKSSSPAKPAWRPRTAGRGRRCSYRGTGMTVSAPLSTARRQASLSPHSRRSRRAAAELAARGEVARHPLAEARSARSRAMQTTRSAHSPEAPSKRSLWAIRRLQTAGSPARWRSSGSAARFR